MVPLVFLMVFVLFMYSSDTNLRWFMAAGLPTTRVDHGGITDAHDASTVCHVTSRSQDDSTTRSYDC